MAPPFRCEHCEYVGPSVRAFRGHLLGRHHMRTDPETGRARPVSPERLHLMLEAHRRDRRNPQQRDGRLSVRLEAVATPRLLHRLLL